MQVVVAGGTGFLGSHLCRGAVERGCAVVSLSSAPPEDRRRVRGVDYRFVDLTSESPDLGFGPNLIFNAAGYVAHPSDEQGELVLTEQHRKIVRNLLRITPASGSRFLHLGSGDEYDEPGSRIPESAPARGRGPYGRAKAQASQLVQSHSLEAGYDFTVLRVFLVYGPFQAENRLIPQLITGLLADRRVPLSTGTQTRDFLYVDDFAEAAFASAFTPATIGRTLNVGTGEGTRVAGVAALVRDLVGQGEIGLGDLPSTRDQADVIVGNQHQITNLTGWTPKTSLREGISRTIDSFRSESH